MTSTNTHNRHLYEFRMKGDYKGAITYYKDAIHKNIPLDEIKAHSFIIPNLLHCLRKNGQEREAFVFMEKQLCLKPGSDISEQWTFEIGWTLYQVLKKTGLAADEAGSKINYYGWLRYLLALPSVCSNGLLWTKLLVKGTAWAMAVPANVDKWASFLLAFDPAGLSSEPMEMQQPGKNDSRPSASPREQHLMQLTKALFAAGRFNECMEQCRRALELIKRFHHGNQLWLSRRMALSLGSLGNHAEAIENMKSLLLKKDEWFIRGEIGNLLLENGEHDRALAWYASAALLRGHSEYKVGLYRSAGEVCLLLPAYSAFADQHFKLAVAVRREKNWKVPVDLFKHVGQGEGDGLSSSMLYEGLVSFWKAISVKADLQLKKREDVVEGKVTRILNEGVNGDGFITDTAGRGIYFRMKRVRGTGVMRLDDRVVCSYFEREFGGRKVLNARWVKKV